MNKVFVYGTLKKGEPNHEELTSRNAQFLADVVTVEEWPLIIASYLNMPFLLYKKEIGKHVHGEMYLVDDETLKFLDWFEGVEDNLYTVVPIEVEEKSSGKRHQVPAYMLADFKVDLLAEQHFFESYSSVNEFKGEYKKSEDSMDETKKLLAEVKADFVC